jgi:hypothetical protein
MQNNHRPLPPVDRPPLSQAYNTPDMVNPVLAQPMKLPVSYRDAPLGTRPPAVWPRQYTPRPLNGGGK